MMDVIGMMMIKKKFKKKFKKTDFTTKLNPVFVLFLRGLWEETPIGVWLVLAEVLWGADP